MVGSAIPNKRGSSWDLSLSVFPQLIEQAISARKNNDARRRATKLNGYK
jgi:hypothetical protein